MSNTNCDVSSFPDRRCPSRCPTTWPPRRPQETETTDNRGWRCAGNCCAPKHPSTPSATASCGASSGTKTLTVRSASGAGLHPEVHGYTREGARPLIIIAGAEMRPPETRARRFGVFFGGGRCCDRLCSFQAFSLPCKKRRCGCEKKTPEKRKRDVKRGGGDPESDRRKTQEAEIS